MLGIRKGSKQMNIRTMIRQAYSAYRAYCARNNLHGSTIGRRSYVRQYVFLRTEGYTKGF